MFAKRLTNQMAGLVCLFVLVMTQAEMVMARETPTSLRQRIIDGLNLTPEQEEWINTSPEGRRGLGEQIGERGGRELAKEMGMEAVFDGTSGKGIPQGPDQVYRAKNGRIAVFETKANSSPKNKGYGYIQGSVEHTLKSAEYVLKSNRASEAQKRAAREILKAAANGKLDVYIIRTYHVQGKITKTIIEQMVHCTKVHQEMAKTIIEALEKSGFWAYNKKDKTAGGVPPKQPEKTPKQPKNNPQTKGAEKPAAGAKGASKALRAGSVGIGIAIDGGFRGYHSYKVEEAFKSGTITENERLVAHGENAAGAVGGWCGAAAGGKGGAIAGAALGSFFGPIGTGVGGVVGGIGGALCGYMAGDAAASKGAQYLLEDKES